MSTAVQAPPSAAPERLKSSLASFHHFTREGAESGPTVCRVTRWGRILRVFDLTNIPSELQSLFFRLCSEGFLIQNSGKYCYGNLTALDLTRKRPDATRAFSSSLWTWPHSGAGGPVRAGPGGGVASCTQDSPPSGASDTLSLQSEFRMSSLIQRL